MSAAARIDSELPAGLAIIQSNRPERLRQLLLAHVRRHPLAPLEEEVILVQSAGIGRWLQLGMAEDAGPGVFEGGLGISAAVRFELPARFLWAAYRAVLGAAAVPESSPFDAGRLRWRLYGLLPQLLGEAGFAPLGHYLAADGEPCRRRWQLAGQLAGLFEQYQIYRADWLLEWEQGRDTVADVHGRARALRDDQAWQPALWRRLLTSLPPDQQALSRAHLHRAFVARLQAAGETGESIVGLPRRVIVFGISTLPAQMVEALAALAEHVQILVCLHNPCRYYWADIIEGRDLLRSRPGRRLNRRLDWPAQLDDETVHRHANPLLAAWGRQGRDFFALLDDHDRPERYAHWFERIDQFEDFAGPSGSGLLQQVQQGILDLAPRVRDGDARPAIDPAGDRSLRFHLAHSRQREVEILHDQLLAALEDDPGLEPRDVIVMVPDIDAYAPHIDAVFAAGDLPYSIADRRERLNSATLKAFVTLLDLPRLRLTASEVVDLLQVPALQRRFGIEADQIERISAWLTRSGIRWGLDGRHRAGLGLERGFEPFSWMSGIRRMLLGHASGQADAFDGILPFAEVAGSEADLAGRLAWLVDRLGHHARALQGEHGIDQWALRLRALIDDFLDPGAAEDELIACQLDEAIDALIEAATAAGPKLCLPLEVVRDALIEQLDQGHVSHRFLGGRINFSTLMPMRSIPFAMVCLLGMNDGDYPRTRKPADFDLMTRPGLVRPGDRSRREDDRYLFLEALLAARRRLYISWVGRSIHNDQQQPPSVLVGQLRDHIAAGWRLAGQADDGPDGGQALLDALTTGHPLQPFSPRYFTGDEALFTFAAEWRRAHDGADHRPPPELPPAPLDGPLTMDPLIDFLRQPLKGFTRQRLQASLERAEDGLADNEPFALDGLESWSLDNELLAVLLDHPSAKDWPVQLARAADRLRLDGRLPRGAAGVRLVEAAGERAEVIAGHWRAADQAWPERVLPGPAALTLAGRDGQPVTVEQWLPEIRRNAAGEHAWITASATRLLNGSSATAPPRWDKVIAYWPMHLLINAAGFSLHTLVAHRNGLFEWAPLPAERARAGLEALVQHWQEGLRRPLPVAAASAAAYLNAIRAGKTDGQALAAAGKAFDGTLHQPGEATQDPYVARWYPDFDRLQQAGSDGDDFRFWAVALYGPAVDHHG
ncbi:MAG: exodeoxyribonuclease V subunit gamma [Wenzhouxiangella sp.]